jgi:hypothetical protein
MNKICFLTLLFTVIISLGTGTALCERGLTNSSALKANLTDQGSGAVLPDGQNESNFSLQDTGNNGPKSVTTLGAGDFIKSSALKVNLTNQNPDVARPGEPVELTLSMQNIGSKP